MTTQERLDYLLETATTPSNRGRLTHTWVAENISLTVADAVYSAVNAVSVPTALRYATGNGIDTSATLWKAQAEAVAASSELLSPHLETLRDFELLSVPRWQVEGYQSEPTLKSVQAEIDAEQAQLAREAISLVWTAKQAVVNGGIFRGEITTLEQIVAAIEGA